MRACGACDAGSIPAEGTKGGGAAPLKTAKEPGEKHRPEPYFNFGGRKFFNPMEKTTSKELAQGLLHSLKKFSDHFYEDFGQRAQTILEVKLDEAQSTTLKREIYMMNMWIISKILSPDRKVLDELHKIYLLPHVNQNQINKWLEQKEAENLKNVLKQDEGELNERYAKYYADWDDKSGGNQSILAMTMLEHMFNNGQPDKRFVDARLTFEVNAHILGMMKFIIDFRKGYEIID